MVEVAFHVDYGVCQTCQMTILLHPYPMPSLKRHLKPGQLENKIGNERKWYW